MLVDFSLYNVNTNLVAITRCGLLVSRCSLTEHPLLAAIEFDISGLPGGDIRLTGMRVMGPRYDGHRFSYLIGHSCRKSTRVLLGLHPAAVRIQQPWFVIA